MEASSFEAGRCEADALPTPIGGIRVDTWELLAQPRELNADTARILGALYAASDSGDRDIHPVKGLASCEVKAVGRRALYPLMLVTPEWRLFIHHATGRARFIAGASWLAGAGPGAVAAELHRVTEWLFGIGKTVDECWKTSRIDLAADFVNLPMHVFEDLSMVVRRSRKATVYIPDEETPDDVVSWDGPKISGVMLGSRGGAVSACIYDKSKQADAKKLGWVNEMHREDGWNGSDTRTRVEFRLRGRGLECWKEINLRLPSVLHDGWREWAPSVWGYLTSKWLRVVITGDDPNRWRWPARPEWSAVGALGVAAAERCRSAAIARLEDARNRARRSIVRGALALASLEARTRAIALHAAADASSALIREWGEAFVASVVIREAKNAVSTWAKTMSVDEQKAQIIEHVDGRVMWWDAAQRAAEIAVGAGITHKI